MNTARAERLAKAAVFQKCRAFQHWVIAELAISFDLWHQLAANTREQTYFCNCPQFPKPCLHAQAFARFLQNTDPDKFEHTDQLPAWIANRSEGQPLVVVDATLVAEQRSRQQSLRHLVRLERAENGFQDLESWLLDTLRRGLATSISEDPAFYQNIASRLADASMRGLSRTFRLLETTAAGPANWPEQTVAVLAEAALALQAFRVRDQLPEALVYDLEAYIGIAIKKELVRTQGESVRDVWLVTGVVETAVEDALQLRRTWLLGQKSQRFALLLEYTHGGVDFQPGFLPGALLEGELIFYPSAFPLRALIAETLTSSGAAIEKMPGYDELENMADAYAAALGTQPWLAQFPVILTAVIPYQQKSQFYVMDEAGKSLPLSNDNDSGWQILALSGGQPILIFGEWDGKNLLVLSAWSAGRFAGLL